MPRPKGTTRIHQAGLADEITSLLKMRWSAGRIVKYVKGKYDIELRETEIWYFREEFVNPEEIMPPQRVQESLCRRAAVIDVITERAKLIDLQRTRVEGMAQVDQQNGSSVKAGNKIKLSSEIEVLSRLLDAHKRDLIDLGILRPGMPLPAESNHDRSLQSVNCMTLIQELVHRGIEQDEAVNVVMIASYGRERMGMDPLETNEREVLAGQDLSSAPTRERLGRTNSPGLRAGELDDQGQPILTGRPPVFETDVR